MTTARSKVKVIKAWGGFTDDKLYVVPRHQRPDEPVYDEPRYAIFPTRKDAARAYQDVRRIEIRCGPAAARIKGERR